MTGETPVSDPFAVSMRGYQIIRDLIEDIPDDPWNRGKEYSLWDVLESIDDIAKEILERFTIN